MEPIARRLCQQLLEPIHLVSYMSDEPTEALQALGFKGYWPGYFATRVATSAPMEGRILYAGLRSLPVPGEPVARLWHAATLLREHRGDGHLAALVSAGIGGQEAHVLHALSLGMTPEEYGRLNPLTPMQLAAIVDGLCARGLVDASAALTAAGRETKDRIESVTDALAAPAYDSLEPGEVAQLIADLEPRRQRSTLSATRRTWSRCGRFQCVW